MKTTPLALLALLAAPLLAEKTVIPQATLDSLDAHLEVTYAKYGDRILQMDIYRPKGTSCKLPGIVCIHGGGWYKGDRTSHTKMAQALAVRNYVAATISYRLSGEAQFPAAIHDCKAAVRFFRANADKYGIDPDHIGAIGLSAGGHLTALLATSSGVTELEGNGGNPDFSSAIQAAVPMGAQTDLLSDRTREVSKTREPWKLFLGGIMEEKTANYRLASPLQHLDKSDPPCWFVKGGNDDPSTRSENFRGQMKKFDLDTGLLEIQGAPHAFLNNQAWFDEMVGAADKFFTTELKK